MNINQICMKCMTGKINEEGKCTSCGALRDAEKNGSKHLPVKTILKGKYLVGRVIGEGGFGITYIGYDLDLEIRVAIKEFCPKNSVERDIEDGLTIYPYSESAAEEFEREKEKFINEARRLAKFRNEGGVVSVLDYFIENGTAYIVMDYIDGITLKSYLKTLRDTTGRNMNMAGVLNLFKPVMETLAKIHKSGIIHRDISPENIMISKDFTKVYLIDFGTARDVENGHTLSEYYKGFYSPIEQRSSQSKGKMEQGPWTDVYALCATIYVCITGRVMSDSVSRIIEDDLIGPSKFGVDISTDMEEVLVKGLAVKPQDRIQSVEELMKAFYGENKPEEYKNQEETVDIESKAEEAETLDNDELKENFESYYIYPQKINMKNEGTMTKSVAGKTVEKKGSGGKISLLFLVALIVGGVIMWGVEYSKLHTTIVGNYYDSNTNTNYESAQLKQERIHDKQSGKYLIQSEKVVAENKVLVCRTWDGEKIEYEFSNGDRGIFQLSDGSKYSTETFSWVYTLTDAYGNCKIEYVWDRSMIVDTEFTKTLALPDIEPIYEIEYFDGKISKFTNRDSGIRSEYVYYDDDLISEIRYNINTQEFVNEIVTQPIQLYGHTFNTLFEITYNYNEEITGIKFYIKDLDDEDIILHCDAEDVIKSIEGDEGVLWEDTKERAAMRLNQTLKENNYSGVTYSKELDSAAEIVADDIIRNNGIITIDSYTYICYWNVKNPVYEVANLVKFKYSNQYKKVGFSIREWNDRWIIVAVFD